MMKVISITHAMLDRRPDREPRDKHAVRTNDGQTGHGESFAQALASAITKENDKKIKQP